LVGLAKVGPNQVMEPCGREMPRKGEAVGKGLAADRVTSPSKKEVNSAIMACWACCDCEQNPGGPSN